jgi:uncharacterized protein YjbI with pentapeptide repeats
MRAATPSPAEPDLPDELPSAELSELGHDDRLSELNLKDLDLHEQSARGVSIKACRLSATDLSGSRLEHLSLVDSVVETCNLANVRGHSAQLRKVSVRNSRVTGIDLGSATLRDVAFRDCRIDLASFSTARLQRVSFEDCILSQTDFLTAQLDSVRFVRCELRNADVRGARLKGCELRRSDLTGLQGVDSLRGIAMEWADILDGAGVWAAALGIEILDPDTPAGTSRPRPSG